MACKAQLQKNIRLNIMPSKALSKFLKSRAIYRYPLDLTTPGLVGPTLPKQKGILKQFSFFGLLSTV